LKVKNITIALMMLLTIITFACPSYAQGGAGGAQSMLTLFASKAYTTTDTKAHNFEDWLPLASQQSQLPLTLTVRNGAQGRPGFLWFRLQIGGYMMASEKNLAGKPEAAIDVTGRMQPGTSQILLEAAGEPGATLSFSLSTPAVRLLKVMPPAVTPGDTVVLRGLNFSSDERQNVVTFNGKPVPLLSASATSITAEVPRDAQPGVNQVMVSVDNVNSESLPVQVVSRKSPILVSTNFWMAPPGAELTITGRNFAENPADNQVFFRDTPAQIVSADPQTIVCVIPSWSFQPGATIDSGGQLNIPIRVVSEGVTSANYIPFDIGNTYQNSFSGAAGQVVHF
jgi:hypothetical protein